MANDGTKIAIGAGVVAGIGAVIFALTRPVKAATILPEEKEKVQFGLGIRMQEVGDLLAQQELTQVIETAQAALVNLPADALLFGQQTQVIETAQAELIELPVLSGVANEEEMQKRIDEVTDPATGEVDWKLVDAHLTPEQIKGIMAGDIIDATKGMLEHYTTLLAEMKLKADIYVSALRITPKELEARIAEAERQIALAVSELARRQEMRQEGLIDELVDEWEEEFAGGKSMWDVPAIPGIIPAVIEPAAWWTPEQVAAFQEPEKEALKSFVWPDGELMYG